MKPETIAGRGVRRSEGRSAGRSAGIAVDLPTWGVKAIRRLSARIQKPGIYPVTLILTPDRRWQLVVEPGRVEELGE